MRTTLTLDDDTAAVLEQLRHDEGKSLKQIVNELLRIGIMAKKSTMRKQPRYAIPQLDAGPCKYPDLDNIGEILAVAEKNY